MPKQKRFYPKKEKLKAQLHLIAAGKKSKKQAMLDAGYTEKSSTHGQVEVFGSLMTEMQMALRKEGFDEQRIAKKISQGMEAERTYVVHDGDDSRLETAPDWDAQHKFLTTGAKLLDVFPAEHLILDPSTLSDDELNRRIEAAAKALTEKGVSGTPGGESAAPATKEDGESGGDHARAPSAERDDGELAEDSTTARGEPIWEN